MGSWYNSKASGFCNRKVFTLSAPCLCSNQLHSQRMRSIEDGKPQAFGLVLRMDAHQLRVYLGNFFSYLAHGWSQIAQMPIAKSKKRTARSLVRPSNHVVPIDCDELPKKPQLWNDTVEFLFLRGGVGSRGGGDQPKFDQFPWGSRNGRARRWSLAPLKRRTSSGVGRTFSKRKLPLGMWL